MTKCREKAKAQHRSGMGKFTGENGARRDLWRRVERRAEARKKIKGSFNDSESKTAREFDSASLKYLAQFAGDLL